MIIEAVIRKIHRFPGEDYSPPRAAFWVLLDRTVPELDGARDGCVRVLWTDRALDDAEDDLCEAYIETVDEWKGRTDNILVFLRTDYDEGRRCWIEPGTPIWFDTE